MNTWDLLHNQSSESVAYNVARLSDGANGIAALRQLFPEGEADSMNFVLFSTSGVHGTYQTIEDEQAEPGSGVTFLIVHPRLVGTRYGTAKPRTPDDFAFLMKLRETSWQAVAGIGRA